MKIKQLDIAGFRSLKNVSWQPGDLNVVIGQNGTGKSNLLRILELIAASAQGQLSKYVQASGGMNAVLWDGSAKSISYTLKTDPGENILDQSEYQYEVEIVKSNFSGTYRIKREQWSYDYYDEVEGQKPSRISLDRDETNISFDGRNLDSPERIPRNETLLSLANSLSTEVYPLFLSFFREDLAGVGIYHDFNVSADSIVRQSSVPGYEKQVAADGQNLVLVLHTLYTEDREFKRSIDSALRVAFGADYEELVFAPASDQRVQLRVRWKTLQRATSAADLSDGFLRYLLLLTVLITPDPPMLIAIDEPETGLHPSMLPIIAEYAVEASSRTQIIFTTHSPQFLDAFTDTKPTTTVTKWENGETSLHVLNEEELAYWLREYSLGELFRAGDLEAIA